MILCFVTNEFKHLILTCTKFIMAIVLSKPTNCNSKFQISTCIFMWSIYTRCVVVRTSFIVYSFILSAVLAIKPDMLRWFYAALTYYIINVFTMLNADRKINSYSGTSERDDPLIASCYSDTVCVR